MARLLALLVLLAGCLPAVAAVSVESLLREMADPLAPTRHPGNAWRLAMQSSHDARSVAPGEPGWFGNDDRSQFRATNVVGGVTECTMVDAKGPGALVRLWLANPKTARLRVYVDGGETPTLDALASDLVGGAALCGEPLSCTLPPTARESERGHNLFLPIPYAKSLRLAVVPAHDGHWIWWVAEMREYAPGTEVESFSPEALARARGALMAARAAISARPDAPVADGKTVASGVFTLAPGAERSWDFAGPGAIRRLEVALGSGGGAIRASLRDVTIRLTFDGETTAELPAVNFFGAGDAPAAFATLRSGDFHERDWHRLMSSWPMPYASSARVTLRNDGAFETGPVKVFLTTAPHAWDTRCSQHFGATFRSWDALRTWEGGSPRDLACCELSGRAGLVVGSALAVFNTERAWWGEGDERVYIDGEKVPSLHGTGTEDHFCYAWCRPEPFSHPFAAQPDGSGNLNPGFSSNVRHRVLDAIPFADALRFDMEISHWRDCRIGYRWTTWHYLRPAAR